MRSPEEEKLARLHDYRSDLEDRIRGLTTKLRQTNVSIAELGPVVAAQARKREWEAGEPERAAMRATPEYQAWREQFLAGERERISKQKETRHGSDG